MSEGIKVGDRYIVLDDIDFLKKNQIVVINSIKNHDLGVDVTFEGFPEDYLWGFPHPCFKKIYPDKEISGFNQYDEFDKIVEQAAKIYRAKNHDYGDSFAKSIQKRGFISALTRIEDKFQRIDNIISTGKVEVKSESLEDTLFDMANYCIMTVIEIRRQNLEKKEYSAQVG